MPPKRRAAGSATTNNTPQEPPPLPQQQQQQQIATDVATIATSATAKATTRQRSSTPRAAKDPQTDAQEKRPVKKPRATAAKKAVPQTVPDAALGQDTSNATETINHTTTQGTTIGESTLPDSNTNTDTTFVHPTNIATMPAPTPIPAVSAAKLRRPFKARGPRGPYKPRKPKPTNTLPPPPPESGLKLLKTSNELAFKDTRPWHDYFQDRIPTYNRSTSLWDFPPPPPRVDVLAPEELNKMITDDYARMKPLPGDPDLRRSATKSATPDPTVDTNTHEQQASTPPCNNETDKERKGLNDTPAEHNSDSGSQSDDNNESDSDENEDSDDNHRSQSVTPGPTGDTDQVGNNKGVVDGKRRRKVKKHRIRIKYSFPAPVPPLEYPYLQSAFPYEKHPPPEQQATTQPDYGQHTQPLPDTWHRPQGGFAMEDLFSQEKLDYSIRMLRKQPIEANRLRMDLYYRRGFQLASKQVLDRARVAYYGKNDYTNKHYLQVPSLYNEIDEARLQSSQRSRDDINILRSLDVNGKLALRGYSLLRATPTAAHTEPPSLATTSTTTTTTATAPMSSGTRVVGGAFSSSSSVPPSAIPSVQNTNTNVDEASEALARDRLAYYEVNQFLGSMFSHRNLGGKVLGLSPRACTILRTLLSGLEKKLVSMGCALQRAELTRRLAEIDTFLSKRHREMIRARIRKGKAKRGQETEREGSQQPGAETSSPDSSLTSSSTPAPMSPATTGTGRAADPTSPTAVAVLERRFYPLWDCDPGEYYIRTATSNNPFTHVSALASAIDDPLDHAPTVGDVNPFLVAASSSSPSKPSQAGTSSGSTPAVDGRAMTPRMTTATTAESGLPFINNPLRIPDEMEPFWRVRNFLERMPLLSSLSSSASATTAPPASSTTVANRTSDIERLRQVQQDLSAPGPSTSTSSSLPLLSAPLMTTSAVDSGNSEIERLRQAQQVIAAGSLGVGMTPPYPSFSVASSSTLPSTTVASVMSMTSEIERLRLAQQELARTEGN
ncbi:hypothetical protein BG015_008037 [Linnemannia schmuckeri]|uniref:Uncharacterized protein n=1 Tax=Linnemannia schmuckeri TaxID=64567 RepID=A0A9P5VAZ5_9FUNG|nr:hypothetical protein BG015_008037 [Linnemannia schmuckeri]